MLVKYLLPILFLFTAISIASAQSFKSESAPMSSGDQKKDFLCLGNSTNGHLALLDRQGFFWLYDGYEMQKWNQQAIENSNFIEAIYLQDSFLYATTSDALLLFDSRSNKPSILAKGSNHYFSQIKKEAYYIADINTFALDQGKIQRVDQRNVPIRKSTYVVDQLGEIFYIYKKQLVWTLENESVITKVEIPEFGQLLVDSWNEKWILNNFKLEKLELVRTKINSKKYNFEEKSPDIFKSFEGTIIGLFDGKQLARVRRNEISLICQSSDWQIVDYWIDSEKGVWTIDEKNLIHHFADGKWFDWSVNEIDIRDKIVGFHADGDIISMIFENSGILQSRRRDDVDDWVWVPHRLNSKLKNLSIKASAQRVTSTGEKKLFLFTENYGVYIIDRKELGILKDGFPGYGIYDVKFDKNLAILLDKGKRWHLFTFGQAERKSLQKIDNNSLPPEITSDDFLIKDGIVIYQSNNRIVQLDSRNGQFSTSSYPYKFDKVSVIDDFIVDLSDGQASTYVMPSRIIAKQKPLLLQVTITTINDDEIIIWPKQTVDHTFSTSDFPAVISAKASYVPSPKSIEYAWKETNNNTLDADYKYKNSTKWNVKNAGEQNLSLFVKLDEVTSSYPLAPIRVIQDVEIEDNSWAIYLSAILAGLLALLLIIARVRSRNQKRKINALQVEKRALELEQKALQLQMNPHFIFNALNGVKGMIALGENKKARQYLTKTSSWIRNMLNDARAEKIEIGREVINLQSYMEIERELQGNRWDFEVEVDEAINNSWKIAPMMIQPFIENAIIHAFKGIDYKGKITLQLNKLGPNIAIHVEDNGVGLQKKEHDKHESVALKLIRDRLKLMHQGTGESKFSLINKSDTNNSDSGVVVKFELPILD